MSSNKYTMHIQDENKLKDIQMRGNEGDCHWKGMESWVRLKNV
jgi:hypothetical protein